MRPARAYQCVSALDLKLGGEPRPLQDTQLSPLGRREIVLCRQMLSQRRQQRVPSLIASARRLVPQQRGLHRA